MQQRLLALRRADEAAGAARDRLVGQAHHCRAALRALRRHRRTRGAPGRPRLGDRAHDLRDHVARAAHDDGVADAHVLAPHLVLVVQRGVGHGDAADEHRLQPRDRRDRAGAADLDVDADDLGRRLLGRELVRDREARRARDEAERALLRRGGRPCRRRRRCRTAARRALRRAGGSSRAGPSTPWRPRAPRDTGKPSVGERVEQRGLRSGRVEPLDFADAVAKNAAGAAR